MSDLETGAAPVASEGNAVASIPAQVETTLTTEAAKPTIEDTMASVYDKLSPPRDTKTQQFTAKTETSAVETDTAPATETTEGQTQGEDKSEPATAIVHPNSLPAALREKWGQVPPEIAEWTAKREADAHKRITELGESAKAAEPIRQVIARYQSTFKGMDAAQAVEKLAAASDFLDRDAVAGIKWLADAYGVDLSKLGGETSPGTEGGQENAALLRRIGQLERQIADTSNRVSSREQQERQTQHQSIEKQVTDFAKDRPYWGELEDDIYSQIHAIRATDANLPSEKVLERAYDRALKLNEGVQAKIDADKKVDADKKAKAEAAKKAETAKKAASINVKSGQGVSPKSSKTIEDTMREVADRLMG